MYLRYYATTLVASPVADLALAYLRSLVRIAPVRLITMSGELEGAWAVAGKLLATDMVDPMLANVVCTEPESWSHRLSLTIPKDGWSKPGGASVGTEKVDRTVELYTAGVRNILIATTIPRAKAHCDAAAKYEAIIVPTAELADKLAGATGKEPVVVKTPIIDHRAFRALITPP